MPVSRPVGVRMDSPKKIAAWLQQASEHFASIYGPRAIQVILRDPHDRVARLIFNAPAPGAGNLQGKTALAQLSRLELQIVRVVDSGGDGLVPAKVIANKTRRKLDSHFYEALRKLCRIKVLLKMPDGYRRF